jgi:RNA polymerase sigma-70 factor (ECF subfamily)
MAITDLDEQVLVRAHQAGDEHAFGQIVRSQHRALYAHAYRRLGSHEAAEDAVQDTLLRAYRALPSFNGDLRLRAWLHRILTNVCHDEGNRRRRQAGLIDKLEAQPVELAPDPVEETMLHDTVRVMSEALADLPESYREALVLRYVDGLSFREVAEVTGISEENARARVHRGRLALHKVLSRVSVMVAFLVPGLRRTHRALDAGADNVAGGGASDHAVSLSTQLASHVYSAAPALTRAAAEGSNLVAAKTSVVATAVAAVAAVAAPVAAYRVYDTAKTPDRPPAAVAGPAKDQDHVVGTADPGVDAESPSAAGAPDSTDAVTSTTVASTSSTLPASVVDPFGGSPVADPDDSDDASEDTTTTTVVAPTDDDTVEPDPGPVVEGLIGGSAFSVTGGRPDYDVSGAVTIDGDGGRRVDGNLAGRVYVSDMVGGDATGELALTVADGTVRRLRFRGTLEREEPGDGTTTWHLTGEFRLDQGADLGLADGGDATVVFQYVDADASSTLSFDLRGPAPTE